MERRLFFLINKAQHRLFSHVDAQTERALGISATQVAALLYVGKHEGCLQVELARALGLNKAAVSGLAGRMTRIGILERRPCDHDGRASRLYLTERGRTLLPAVSPLLQSLNEQLTEGFTDTEIDVVVRFLNHILNRFPR